MRSWIFGPTVAAFIILAASPCLAHEEAVIVAGRNAAGELVVDADFDQPVGLAASIFPGITGYATGELAFHSTSVDEPANDFFQLSATADFRFVLLAKDPGMEVWNDTGSGFMQVNQSFYIGPAAFDTHPIWNLVSGTTGQAYALTLKLIDLNHVYRDSQPFVLSFTPGAAQTSTLATTTSLVASATTLVVGQPLTLTATVAPGPATTVPSGTVPTGNVTFFDGFISLGAVAINTAGVATLSRSNLTAGSHSFTASYGGHGSFIGSTSAARVVQVTAAAPDFSISANVASLTVTAGQSATTTLTITPLNGSTQTVTVGCGALPPFVSCSFSPAASVTLTGSQPSTVTLTIRTNVVAALLQRIEAQRYASVGGLLGLTWLLAGLRRRTRNRCVLLALCLGLAACGGGDGGGGSAGSSSSSSAVTPRGNYTVSVSAEAGASSHPLNLTVVVQ